MLDFFQSVIDFFSTAWQLVTSFISGFVNMISIIPFGIAYVSEQLVLLPAVLLSFAMAALTIRVIYLILGRNS